VHREYYSRHEGRCQSTVLARQSLAEDRSNWEEMSYGIEG